MTFADRAGSCASVLNTRFRSIFLVRLAQDGQELAVGPRHGGQVAQLANLLLDLLVSSTDRPGRLRGPPPASDEGGDGINGFGRKRASPVYRSLRMMSRALSLSCGGNRIIGIVLYLSCSRKMRAVLSLPRGTSLSRRIRFAICARSAITASTPFLTSSAS